MFPFFEYIDIEVKSLARKGIILFIYTLKTIVGKEGGQDV